MHVCTMKGRLRFALAAAGSCLLAVAGWSLAAEPEREAKPNPPTVAEARQRAETMHSIYAATLEVMHQHYFHNNKAMVPARALEEVFAELDAGSQIKANWISVNTKPMSVHHEPGTDFEKKAAQEISAGKGSFEAVEGGIYRRAGAIALGGGCVSCHTGFFSKPAATPRFAALVIEMRVQPGDAPSP